MGREADDNALAVASAAGEREFARKRREKAEEEEG